MPNKRNKHYQPPAGAKLDETHTDGRIYTLHPTKGYRSAREERFIPSEPKKTDPTLLRWFKNLRRKGA